MMDTSDEIEHANRVRSIVSFLQMGCIAFAILGFIVCIIAGLGQKVNEVGLGVALGIAQAAGWAVLWALLSILRLIAVQTQHTLQADLQRQQAALRQRQTPSEFGPRPPPAP